MRLITEEEEVKKLHKKLVASLEKYISEEITVLTGHMGNSLYVDAFYSADLDMWWYFDISEGKSSRRYWNAFGLGKPRENRLSNIICEINYPVAGINKRVAAVWVEEGNEYFLLHSGKIGGGRAGIGKVPFQDRYIGDFQEFPIEELSGKYTEIGNIDSPALPRQIKLFVEEVDRVKKEIVTGTNSPQLNSSPLEKLKANFNDEFTGTKQYETPEGYIIANCNHGLVVNALKQVLSEKGFKVANDQQKDLYVYNNKPQITHVFEIKTTISSQVIFTAVGQLMVNSARIEPKPKLIFVIPEKLNANMAKTLIKLNIQQLIYSFTNNTPIFKDLESKL